MKKRYAKFSLLSLAIVSFALLFFLPFIDAPKAKAYVGEAKVHSLLRQQPSGKADAVSPIAKGTLVFVLNKKQQSNETWYFVHNGLIHGWLLGDFLNLRHNHYQLASPTYMYPTRQVAAKQQKLLKAKSKITIEDYKQQNKLNWVLATAGTTKGWIPLEQLVVSLPAKEKKQVVTTPKVGSIPLDTYKGQKVVFLTFDDGPTKYTQQLLNTLKKYKASATFFMVDGNMKKYPQYVARMAKEGHALGSHSVTHRVDKVYRSKESVVNEMLTCMRTIETITGETSTLIRVPYGSKPYMSKPGYRDAVMKANMQMWDWNVDSLDWRYRNASFVQHTIKQIETMRKHQKVPVVLLHDIRTTVTSLPFLLDYLQKQGYKTLPLTPAIQPYMFK